jgi:Domain of unknown function (DUF6285)
MHDRPTIQELLAAVQMHLETQISPAIRYDAKLHFHTLVAVNILKIVSREIDAGSAPLIAEWERLNGLQGTDIPLSETNKDIIIGLERRNELLCQAIRNGEYDAAPSQAVLYAHLMANIRAQLEISNPKFLQALSNEPPLR